jgi:23S rRNA pseudouridine1911/1915/1917 synthase
VPHRDGACLGQPGARRLVAVDFSVVAEEEDFLVVEKPSGLLVHPTKPGGPQTLWHGLRELLAYELVNGGQIGILTRLDRETSGLVLVAKTATAARELSRELATGRVHKEYLALVFGWPEEDGFTVDQPLRRLGEVRDSPVWLQRAVDPGGQAALTEFRVLQRGSWPGGQPHKVALLWAGPQTGRTHQIRVHAAHAGFPLLGDKLYARGPQWYLRFIENGWQPEMEEVLLLPRHALHAMGLRFSLYGREYSFRSPWPSDWPEIRPLAGPN